MHKPKMFLTFAAASLALSSSAVLMAQPAETPASDNAATPAAPATPATPADPATGTAATPATPADPAAAATPAPKQDELAPDAATQTEEEAKAKSDKKKGATKPR